MSNQTKITLSYPQVMALMELGQVARFGNMLDGDAAAAIERIAKVSAPRMMGSDRWRPRFLELLQKMESR